MLTECNTYIGSQYQSKHTDYSDNAKASVDLETWMEILCVALSQVQIFLSVIKCTLNLNHTQFV